MKQVTLANGKIETTELCLGTLTMGRLQRALPTHEGAAVVRRALELGVRFIDTAQVYGSYGHIAEALSDFHPHDLVVATKSHARSAEDMRKAIAEARQVMGLERIDIFHLHLVRSVEDIEGRAGAIAALLEARGRGEVTALGASMHTLAGLRAAIDRPELEVLFPIVNRKGLGILDGDIHDQLELLREARARGKRIYAMKPLGGGHLSGEAESAIRWVRDIAEVDAIAIGMKTTSEVEMNVHLFNDEPVPTEIRSAVDTNPRRIIVYDLCEACGRCVEACDQQAVEIKGDKAVVDQERCILCGYCAEVCPQFCIRVV